MIIGIIGKARSGKDTFAKMLADVIYKRFGKRFVLMAYAQELKLRIQKDFDLTYEQLWGDEKEVEDKRYPKNDGSFWTPREIMQFVGTGCFRTVDTNFWIRTLFRVIDENEYKGVIVTDVRYPNEADPIKERGGYLIKVTSDRADKPGIHGENHTSETSMDTYDGFDIHIKNDGSLDDLYKEAEKALQLLVEAESKKSLEVVQNGQEKR